MGKEDFFEVHGMTYIDGHFLLFNGLFSFQIRYKIATPDILHKDAISFYEKSLLVKQWRTLELNFCPPLQKVAAKVFHERF